MKFQRPKEKKQNRGLVFGLLLLFILASLGFNFRNFKLPAFDFFTPQKLVTPLSKINQETALTEILLDKNIAVDFPLASTDSAILAHLKTGGEVLFSREKDFALQAESLQVILSRLETQGKKVKKVDFRFEKPTVVY